MSRSRTSKVPAWWPPKVGDVLEHSTLHSAGRTGIKHVVAKLHVLSVFADKTGGRRVVTAEWFPGKRRWNYEIMTAYDAEAGRIWPASTRRIRQ